MELRLESATVNDLELELLRAAVVVVQSEDFANHAAARFALDMDDVIDRLADLRFNVLEGGLRVARRTRLAKRRSAFAAELAWMVASDPVWPVLSESSKRPRFDAANFAEDDAVGPPAQRGLQ